jgi:hypothetical protein
LLFERVKIVFSTSPPESPSPLLERGKIFSKKRGAAPLKLPIFLPQKCS